MSTVGAVPSDSRFWLAKEPASIIFSNLQRIRKMSSKRRQGFLTSMCLYDESDLSGFGLYGSDDSEELSPALSMNVIRPNVDTLSTQICKARPLPMAITEDGTFSQQKRAKMLNQCIEGQFVHSRVWEANNYIVRDAVLHGTGFAYCYREGNKILYDRVFPWEVESDPRDALYGSPRTLYLTRIVDKLILKELYPKFAEKIESSDPGFEDFSQSKSFATDTVTVCEAWHLPSSDDAGDGWHYIAVSNAVLKKEEYKYEVFPIFPYYTMPPSIGYYGTGFGRMLMGVQYTVNVLAQRCQRHAELAPSYLYVPNGSDVEVDSLDNMEWPIITGNPGMQPTEIQPAPFQPQLWEFVKQVYNMGFDLTGVSQTAAQSDLPKALREASGVALDRHSENRSERFYVASKLYEQFCVDVAWHMVRLFEEIVKDKKPLKIRTASKRGGRRILEKIDYKKVRMDVSEFTLDVWPTTMLHHEPARRAATVEAWINAGFINKDQGKRLLEFPDVDRVNNIDSAQFDVIEEILDNMCDPDVTVDDANIAPEPLFDLQYCMQRGMQRYNMAVRDKEPEERLQLLRDWILAVGDLMTPIKPAMAGQVPAQQQQPEQGSESQGPGPIDLLAAQNSGQSPS